MQATSSQSAPALERSAPAWLFSLAFHGGMIALLGVAVTQPPRGAADEPGRSTGIVLKRTSAEGDLYEGEEEVSERTPLPETSAATNQLATLPTNDVAAEAGRDLPQLPAPGPGATTGGDQPSAQQMTTGGGKRGSPGEGGSAQVSVFGVQGDGNKFVYVFDRSASMEGPPLAAAKRQLIESLDSLEGIHQFHIIFFNSRLQTFDATGGGRRIAFATDRNKQLAANFVGGISADGGTDRYVALKAALNFAPDVIFFLTDADDPMPAGELEEITRASHRSGTAICVIEFGRQSHAPGDNFLKKLANESGGQYGYVNTARLAR